MKPDYGGIPPMAHSPEVHGPYPPGSAENEARCIRNPHSPPSLAPPQFQQLDVLDVELVAVDPQDVVEAHLQDPEPYGNLH
jgi:hypothetical protein